MEKVQADLLEEEKQRKGALRSQTASHSGRLTVPV